ncbi:enoyl-CoA hydratase [Niveispirillum sp.]|uniref:enoyl-CoA hydratase n=1 Tax=Niveispirillum sp. TaxID=1917217 RepID=UPI001B431770|nr:enoyl-CoA hydratase [Niveispirillum sp.]MBP7336281.1 enoyl-CoA hydratase [Niveispirillum sp.]
MDSAPQEQNPDQFVRYEVKDAVAWIWLARPQYSNAQNYRMLNELDGCFRRAVEDDAVRAIVLGGEGKHFSAGHDLGTPDKDKHLPRERIHLWPDHLTRGGAEAQYALEQDAYLGLCRRWQEVPKPTVAMVQGACIAGGVMLAMMCDMIVASDDAYFQDPVLRMGVPGVEYTPHLFDLPPRIAREFLMLGQRLTAQRAYDFGVINRVVPRADLEAQTAAIAADLAKQPAFGMVLAKQAMNFIENIRGKRTSMDALFHIHHLAHAHNQLVTGNLVGGMDAKAMSSANKAAAGEGGKA